MAKPLEIFCKTLDFDLSDIDSFDHLKGLAPKRLYSPSLQIFPAKSPEKLVVCSDKPVDSKEIGLHFQQDSDFPDFSMNLSPRPEVFTFDGVFGFSDSQESFFLGVAKKNLGNFIENDQSCGILLMGPSRPSKNYLLRGGDHKEKGLVLRILEELLRFSNETSEIFVEISLIYKENIHDLLANESETRRDSSLSRKVRVSTPNEMKNLWDLSQFRLASIGAQLNEPFLKEKAHLLVSFSFNEAFSKRFSVFRLGDFLADQSGEAKSLKKYLNSFPLIKPQDQDSILSYRLATDKYARLSTVTVISQQSTPEANRSYLEFSQKAGLSNPGPATFRPPKSPSYQSELAVKKTPESKPFARERPDLDRDFSNLVERYNRSKLLIESLPRKPQTYEKTASKSSGVLANIEQDIMKLKSHIAEKLESSAKKSEFLTKNRRTELVSEKQELNKGSINKLKGAFLEKEALMNEKVETLRRSNEDLKENLRDYIEKKDELERENHQKDAFIEEITEKAREMEKALVEECEALKELREKYEETVREKQSIAGKNEELERKIQKKAQKVQSLKQKIEISRSEDNKSQEKNNGQIRALQKNIEELETNLKLEQEKSKSKLLSLEKCDQELVHRNERIQQLSKHVSNQEAEIQLLKDRLSEESLKFLDLQKDIDAMKSRYADLKESLQLSEAKLVKTKNKAEEEKKRIIDEKELAIQKKKAKCKKAKSTVKELMGKQVELLELKKGLDQELAKLTADKNEALMEIDSQKQQIQELKEKLEEKNRKLDVSSQEKLELQASHQTALSESGLLKAELDRLRKSLKAQEKKSQELEEQAQRDYKEKSDLKQEVSQLADERASYKELSGKLETQLDFLQNQHDQEISDLDKRAEKLIDEMRTLKEENQDFRAKEADLRKALAISEETINAFKEKYLKLKFSSRGLKNHLKEVEERLKDYMTERQMELKEMEITKENTQRVIHNKMKTLDEIQNMVKNYRLGNRKMDFPGFKE